MYCLLVKYHTLYHKNGMMIIQKYLIHNMQVYLPTDNKEMIGEENVKLENNKVQLI